MLAYSLVKKLRRKEQAAPGAQVPPTPNSQGPATLENKDALNHDSQPEVTEVAPNGEQNDPGTQPVRNLSEPQISREERLAARRYRILLIIGLFFPFALQALDVTIIASALPWIASDFRKKPCE
jgi:hypothetical protein